MTLLFKRLAQRIPKPWRAAALALLAAVAAFQVASTMIEEAVRSRLRSVATRISASLRVDRIHVGVWPPLRIAGLTFDRPDEWNIRVDDLRVQPQFWNRSRPGLAARISVGSVHVTLPADLELAIQPTAWDVDRDLSGDLREPALGLTWSVIKTPAGRRVEMEASHLDLDQLLEGRIEGRPTKSMGLLDGGAYWGERADRGFDTRWRFVTLGAEIKGMAVLSGSPGHQEIETSLELRHLDFGGLFSTLGIDLPDRIEPAGLLSGTIGVKGPVGDPARLAVTQRLNFKGPPRMSPALLRLRGDFNHEVTTNTGGRVLIEVSPASPDFIARADIPPLFIRTLLIAEDAAFYSHEGLDLTELPRAIATNRARGGAVRGASTITQQLAKNLFLTRERSLNRKLQELALSFLLEATLGKDRILEIYLNIIEWGPGLYGLRPAARHYFEKEPQALTPRESAFLVALIPGPVKYQRSFANGELTPGFETLVENLLVKLRSVDALSEDEYQAALAQTLALRGKLSDPEAGEDGKPSLSAEPLAPTPHRLK